MVYQCGAVSTVDYLTLDELDTLEDVLHDLYPDEEYMEDVTINDFFWYEIDLIAKALGYERFEDIMHRTEEE